jgi:hypothetical protein
MTEYFESKMRAVDYAVSLRKKAVLIGVLFRLPGFPPPPAVLSFSLFFLMAIAEHGILDANS